MRIRKRQIPLPLSSLLPIPLSDPLLTRINPLVQLYLDDDDIDNNYPHQITPRPSDQPIGGSTNGQDSSPAVPAAGTQHEKKALFGKEERWVGGGGGGGGRRGGEEEEEEEERSSSKCYNDTRGGGSFFGARLETTLLVPQQSAASSDAQEVLVGKWGTDKGERAFPLKKKRRLRRGSFDKGSNNYEEIISATVVEEIIKDKKMLLKNKMYKKCVVVQDGNSNFYDSDQGEGFKEESSVAVVVNGAKKKGRGGALMEGSRCSRVNGRGWRCCQQTLVGYSLCEHHLGKGRLRSMTSVRSRSITTTTATPAKKVESSPPMLQMPIPSLSFKEKETMHALLAVSKAAAAAIDVEDDEQCCRDDIIDHHQKVIKNIAPIGMVSISTTTKKKLKLGVVKARSMSSLLGQPNNGMINLDCGDRKI